MTISDLPSSSHFYQQQALPAPHPYTHFLWRFRESQGEIWIMYITAANRMYPPPDFLRTWAPLLCSESHWCIWVGLHLTQATPSQWLRATGVLWKGGPLTGDRGNLWWPMLAGGHLDCLAKAVCASPHSRMLPPTLPPPHCPLGYPSLVVWWLSEPGLAPSHGHYF